MLTRQGERLGLLLLLALLAILVMAAFPYLASAFHLEAGGRAMESPEPDPSSSLEHLQQAIRWDQNNAQAYRALGRVHRAEGEWSSAVGALTRFTELRPANALGYVELAEVYGEIESEMVSMQLFDLVASLPLAEAPAAQVVSSGAHGQSDSSSQRVYVPQSSFTLPPGIEERPTLFVQSPATITYTLALPPEPSVLRFALGFAPEADNPLAGEATFGVTVNSDRVFLEHLDRSAALEGWQERVVDLSAWAGQEIALTLAVAPGRSSNTFDTWAAWGQPRVVDAQYLALEVLEPGEQRAKAWMQGGFKAEDLIARGQSLRLAKQYDEALSWYRHAMWLEPGLGDTWYYVGQLYEDQDLWEQAVDAYQHAVVSNSYDQVGRSSALYRIGAIHHRHHEPQQPDEAFAAYQAALAADDFRSARDAAWVHARLGQLHYTRDQEPALAEAEMLEGLALAPGDKWLHYVLGDLYRELGKTGEAKTMYEQALAIDPEFGEAQKRLAELE